MAKSSAPIYLYYVWTTKSFLNLCKTFEFNVIDYLDVDDKVGNGFAIVIETGQTSDNT